MDSLMLGSRVWRTGGVLLLESRADVGRDPRAEFGRELGAELGRDPDPLAWFMSTSGGVG